MANKKFFWVMLVMTLAFGMTVVGCPEREEGSASVVVKNENGKTIVKVWTSYAAKGYFMSTIDDDSISITTGNSKTYNITWEDVRNNGTQQDADLYVTLEGNWLPSSTKFTVNNGKTTTITFKSDNTFSVQ